MAEDKKDIAIDQPASAEEDITNMEDAVGDIAAEFENIPEKFQEFATNAYDLLLKWVGDENTYWQIGIIAGAIVIASILAGFFRNKVKVFRAENESEKGFKWFLARTGRILFPVFLIIFLGIATKVSQNLFGTQEFSLAAKRLATIYLCWVVLKSYITNEFFRRLGLWVLIPIATLHLFGYLDETIAYLDAVKFEVGDIKFSIYTVLKTALSAVVLFWMGRVSNSSGQSYIRSRANLEIATKELLVKLFEIGVYFVVFLLLLEVVGIDLTALAVFGGALGVGLGFGLQTIASNFISGMILLLEKSIVKDDIIELDDGTFGKVKHLGSRATTIETYDGKEIMVPNESFMSSRVIHWTHSSASVRYEVRFGVSYDADIHFVCDVVRKAVAAHPDVQTDKEMPDVELDEFGDSSINMLCEFWSHGIDEGKNRFTANIRLLIWETLRDNDIEIPFPQRDLHIKTGDIDLPAAKKKK